MDSNTISQLVSQQRTYFQTGATLPVESRLAALSSLRAAILRHESEIAAALKADLGKSANEAFMCETGLVLSEISFMEKHIRRLSREHRVKTPLPQYVSRCFVKPSPYGTVLIMSPWNYPLLLTLDPLVEALAAGNTAVLKPSAYSPATTAVVSSIISEIFSPEYVAVVTGGRSENQSLLQNHFDLIFFTGSQAVGKTVMASAAQYLTPVILELGGKSPCIVDESANISLSARRIVFGKYLNCGQTCVAPDYVLCHESVRPALISALKNEIVRQFGPEPLKNDNYGKIITRKHFDRICSLIDMEKTVCGGSSDSSTLRIAPTILDGITWEDPVMQQEIFGPVLPILTFRSVADLPGMLADKPKPLAFYVFSKDKQNISLLTSRCQYGGGCINDTIIHLSVESMGFGGVGESGMGAYHGETGFRAFSHEKSMVDKKLWLDLSMRYQPYTALHDRMIRMFLK